MKTILSFDTARYEVIEMANGRRSVGREQSACLEFINHCRLYRDGDQQSILAKQSLLSSIEHHGKSS